MHIDEDLYQEAKYHTAKLIKQRKSQFYKEKLKENISKPKELWKALKSLSLLSKKCTTSNICLKKDDKVCFADKINVSVSKELFCNLGCDLVAKLPPPSNRFGLDTVRNYYQDILGLLERLHSSENGFARIFAPSFKNFPERLSISAALSIFISFSNYSTRSPFTIQNLNLDG